MSQRREGVPIRSPSPRLDAIFVYYSKTAPFCKISVEIAINNYIRNCISGTGQLHSLGKAESMEGLQPTVIGMASFMAWTGDELNARFGGRS